MTPVNLLLKDDTELFKLQKALIDGEEITPELLGKRPSDEEVEEAAELSSPSE